MKWIRCMLQVGTFVFFAAWLLCLVTGRSFRVPEILLPAGQGPVPAEINIKPSPIDMLKQGAE